MAKAPDPLLMRYLDTRFEALHADIRELKEGVKVGVEAKQEVSTLKAQLKAVWFFIGALPVLGAFLAYIGWIAPVEAAPNNPTRHG